MVCCQHQVLQLTQLTNLLPGTFSYICTKIKQSLYEQIQQQQYLAISSNIKHQQFVKIQKCNFQNFTVIDLQTNTTKVVVMTFPNYNKKDFVIHQKNFQLFTTHQSIKINFSAHLSHLQRSSHTTWNALESNALVHPTPQLVLFNYHATKPKKHTCHHMHKQCFYFITPQNDPNFHLTMLHKDPIHIGMPHWNFTQTWYLSRANHVLHHEGQHHQTSRKWNTN